MTSDLVNGAVLAGFRVEALLGRGGMASVYLAQDLRLGRRVALKVLSPDLAGSVQFQRRFHRESRILASLDHPNIVPVYQAGEANGRLYIAMRYVEGSDLNALLDRVGRLDAPTALRVLSQVAAALQAAHDAGLVHRDVKPGNVLVAGTTSGESAGRTFLTDFGLTKQLSSLSNLTAVGNVMGTLQYLAPEQISGQPVDARTDIYALGGLAYRCLTGEPPFERDEHAALLWAHLSEAAPPVSERVPELPEAVDDVVWTAMAKAPEDRYPSAAAFAEALTEALGVQPAAESAPLAVVAELPRPQPPRPRPAAEPLPASAGARDRERSTEPPAPAAGGRPAGGDGHQRDPEAPSTGSRRLQWPLAALALAVALAVVAVVLVAGRDGDGPELARQFPADGSVPYAVSVPAEWGRSTTGHRTAYAPDPIRLLQFFTTRGAPDVPAAWNAVGGGADGLTGLYTFFLTATIDPALIEETLTLQVPQRVVFEPGFSPVTLDGREAQLREGDIVHPGDETQRVHFQSYVVADPDNPANPTVILFFAAPAGEFEANRDLFGRIAATVDFPAAG